MIIKLNESTAERRRVPIFLVGTDGKSPATGESGGTPQISKNWGAWTNCTNVLVGGPNGSYYVELATAEADTLGVHRLRYKSANTCERPVTFQVVAFDPYAASDLGLAALTALVTAQAQPAQGAPPAQATPIQQLTYLFTVLRNKNIQKGNFIEVYADDGVTLLFKAPIAADQQQTQITRDEFVSGA